MTNKQDAAVIAVISFERWASVTFHGARVVLDVRDFDPDAELHLRGILVADHYPVAEGTLFLLVNEQAPVSDEDIKSRLIAAVRSHLLAEKE